MSLKNRRFILVLLLCAGISLLRAQTLYWVGGSGNFNDAGHWSLKSGGHSANSLPDAFTNVIFDDNSGVGYFEVSLGKNTSVNSLRAKSFAHIVKFNAPVQSTLNIGGSLYLSPLVRFDLYATEIYFHAGGMLAENEVEFGLNTVNGNLYFGTGRYNFSSVSLTDGKSIYLNKGEYNFKGVTIVAGNLINNDPAAKINIEKSYFKITNKLKVLADGDNFRSESLYLVANIHSQDNYIVSAALSASKKLSSVNYVNAICPVVISASPSCSGPCTGILSVNLSTVCNDPPYDILVSSGTSSCSTTASTLSISGLTTPTNYIATNACSCTTNYQVLVFDNSGNFSTQNVNFLANPVTLTSSSIQPRCSNSCDGRFTGNIFGTPPFSVAITPTTASPFNFTTALTYTLNNLCIGTYTFNITDASGCTAVLTRSISGPATLLTNAQTRNLNCNSVCNGAYSISPTGGTAGYTINFSTGSTLTATTGGTVSLSSLCAGVISATVTDSKSCTAVASNSITQPTAYTITPTQTNITCPNLPTGAASVAVSGGGGSYTYTWSPSGGNAAGATGLSAGSYTVSISDALSCITTRTFTITQPASITLVPSISNLTCNAVCNGGATVAASGPTTAISFTWLATGGTVISNINAISGRCAGNYTVIAKDAPSSATCVLVQTITITQPPAFTLTPVTQSISCATNTCSGSATVSTSGSNGAPFTYTWTPGSITSSVGTSLCAGNYTVSVRDASSCVTSTTITIAQPPTFTPAITVTSVSCNGVCSGVINASPSGGVLPYTYTLISASATVTTSPPYTNLCAGNYTLRIRDSGPATCAQVFTTTIQQAPVLNPIVSTTSVTCFNACNGSLGGSASGGTPTYTFSWSTPSGTVAGGSLSGRCAGVYTLFVRDANNCTVSATSTLTQPGDMTLSIVPTNVACNSGSTGVLSANVTGGTPGYTMSWSNGFTGNPNTGLGAGSYTLTVTDLNSCVKTRTSSITQPLPITITRTTGITSCASSCDGTATALASGGNPPYSYSFNSSPVVTNTTGIITGLCAGNYIASVTDASACPSSTVFSITSPPLLSAAITGTLNSCTACTGAATVTGSNGTPGYTYVWTNSLSTTVGTASVATALCTGNYTVSVIDSKNCVATATVGIQQTVISAVVSGGTGIQCFGACTGSAVVSPSGGSPPYNYTWTPSAQNAQTATSLCAGNYTVTIKEQGGSGCMSTATINIATPSSITVSGTQSSLTCAGVCNGSLNATASGGTGALTYSWSPGGQTSSSVTGLCAGSYTLQVRDANNCTVTPQTFSITQPASISVTFTNTTPTGCTLSNGSICVTASGGSGSGFTYTWSPVTGNSSCLTGLSSGVYSVVVRDGSGCSVNTSTTLNSPSGPTITVSQQSVTCFGSSTGAATINATGATPFSYTWAPAVAGNTPIATGLNTGTYVVSVRDGNNCVTNQSVVITQPTSLTVNANVTNSKCSGGPANGSITVAPGGATAPYSYAWTGPSLTATTQNVTGLGPGIYSLTITDAQSCSTQTTFVITAPPAITITASSSRTVICNGATNGSITATASGGTPPLSYTWAALSPFSGSTTATVLNLGPGVYSVNAIDGNSCVSSTATWTLAASTLTSAIAQQSASCSNSCNASATLNVSGGAPTFTFSWSFGTSTTNVLGGLCVGNYTGSVVDGNGCISQKGFTISPASLFSISATSSQPLCSGSCNGSAAITPTNGIGTVSYSWSPSGSGQNPTNLCAGIYTVVAMDNNSCSATSVITLTNPPAILANVTSTNPLCNNNCNGIAVINPTNAIGAVTVTWLPSGSGQTITGLCAGTYTALIQDANGCQDTQTFTLSNPPVLTVNSSIGPATCGSPNGSITLIPSGGTPGYTYTWSPNVSSTVSASGLAAQVYTVVVKDNANCSNTVTIPLSNSNGPTAPISFTNVMCFGQTNGGVAVGTLSGGTPPYLPPVWITPPPSQTATSLSNIGAGNYTVQLEDSNGCQTFTGATITQPSSITIVPNMSLPTCNGICNGSITLNTSGGVPAYSYSWLPTGATTSVVTSLCAGDYTVLIGHNSGSCTQTQTFTVPGQVNLTFTGSVVPNNCFGNCNGVATVSVVPTLGIPSPFAFSWSNGATGPGPLSASVSGLCNGTYSVIATGANGCFNTHTVNITSPTQLTVSSAVTQPSCNLCNGSTTVTPGGGSGSSYTLNWSNGATTSTLNNLCAGLYQLTVNDNLGCIQTTTVIVDNSAGITGHTVTTSDIPCGATCTGAATIAATGTNVPITYNWINPAASGSVQTNLCAGTYFLQMQDAQGCIRNASVNINAATSITLSSFVKAPDCGLTNGLIQVAAAGGTPTYNFSWVPSAANTGTLTNLGPSSYTLTVTDSSPGGCPTTSVINVSNLTGPQVAVSPTNINCFNACTGAVLATATGTSPFTYNWSTGGSTPGLSNLCKGIITLTVTDGNGCVTVRGATLTDNPAIQTGIPAITQPSCGLCNGQAQINAFGGVGPYTYSWTSGASTPSIGSLCAGIYQLTVRDNLNCSQTQNVIINNSNGITGHTFSVQNVTCGGNCDGAATVTPVGGNLPISFSWINPSLASATNSAGSLCAGIYFVQMQDAQGCLRTASTSISPATNITVTPFIVPPACGQSNGSITVLASGGTPTYTFSWAPSVSTTGTVTNVGPGSYTLTVSDTSPGGCPTSTVVNISNLNAPTVAFTATHVNCFNACTGALQANVTGTAPPFTYNWTTGGNSPNITNLCQGVITLTVTDTNSCSAVRSATINENPPLLAGAPQVTQPSCNQCNGQAVVNAIGGMAPYTYSWTSGATGASVFSLCAGLYQVVMTDNLNCQQTQNVIINNSSGITSHSFAVQNVPCASTCNGGATVTPVGGTNPISFSWINPVLSSTLSSAGSLCAGTYFVKMTDAMGCVRTGSTNITAASDMTITNNVTQPGCGQTNGEIGLNVSGGTSPYTFSWSPVSASTQTLGGLSPGNYTVTVTDQNGSGCSETLDFSLSNLNGPSLTFTQTNATCFGSCDGSITITPTGTAATTFTWSTGNTTASSSSLCAGIITLTASANGCSTVRSFTIQQNPRLEFNYSLKKLSCQSTCDGLITVQAVGGKLLYTFGGTSAPNSNQSTTLCAGNYTLTVTDAAGCAVDSVVQLTSPAAIIPTVNALNSSCSSVADGSASVNVSGGMPSYQFAWMGPAAFTASTSSIMNILSGTYTLSVTDSLGCRKDSVLKIITTVTIDANAGLDTIVCPGSSVALSGLNSQGAVNYSWFLLPNNTASVSNTSTFVLPNAIESYTYELIAISSTPGCFDRDTVVVNAYTVPYIDAGPSYTIPVFSTVTIGGNPTTSGIGTVTWSPPFALSDVNAENPVASNTFAITYTASIMYGKGCIVSDTMQVILYPEIRVNNGFSPNSDGKNDVWIIDYLEQFPDNTVEIYNRWGDQLFFSRGYQTPFDGKYKGNNLPVGTYYYVIHLNHPAYPKPYTGPLTIFR